MKLFQNIIVLWRGQGNVVRYIVQGVTDKGICVSVAEYADERLVATGAASVMDDYQPGNEYAAEGPPFAAYNDRQYSVFIYPLKDVKSPGFADELEPRHTGEVTVYRGSGIDIAVDAPEDPMPVDWEETLDNEGLLSGLLETTVNRERVENDPDSDFMQAYERVKRKAEEYREWRKRNTLHLPQVRGSGGDYQVHYRHHHVKTFEDAAS